MTSWWVTLVVGVGGAAGITALIRLFWLEPKVARQDEIRSLWSENRAQRRERDELTKRIVVLERHLMKCESDNEHMRKRLVALEER